MRAAAHAKGAAAVSAVLADAGVAPADVVLYAFGGAGALHASGVAEAAGIFRVRSFLFGSIFSACGVASGDVRQVVDAVLTSGDDAADVVARLVRRAALDLEAELLDPATAALSLVVTTTGGDRVFSGSGERIVEAVAAADRTGWRRLALDVHCHGARGAADRRRAVRWSGDANRALERGSHRDPLAGRRGAA